MKLRHLFAALLFATLPAAAARAGVFISIAPPPLVTYEQPACPTDGYLWTPGYWAYDNDSGSYYWVDGVWVAPPRVGYLWTPGYWGYSGSSYVFNDGYWGPTVGFYGGINYGYGYGGYGYYGGRWDGGRFRYNTAITRVNTTVIHNTYVDRNAARRTTSSRASFNGRGGVSARPDATQLAAARGSHLRATGAQANVLKQARTTHTRTAGGPSAARNRTANTARNTPAANPSRNLRTARTTPALTNTARSNVRTTRPPNTVRTANAGRNRTAITRSNTSFGRPRGPQVARSPQPGRAPQVVRQARAPQAAQKNQKGRH